MTKPQSNQREPALGESLGGSALIQSLRHGAKFDSIVAECPFAAFQRVAANRILLVLIRFLAELIARPLARLSVAEIRLYLRLRYLVDLSQASPLDAVACATTPILLIHGTADRDTPVHQITAANPKSTQLWLVPDAQHSGGFAVASTEFEERVLRFVGNPFTAQLTNADGRKDLQPATPPIGVCRHRTDTASHYQTESSLHGRPKVLKQYC